MKCSYRELPKHIQWIPEFLTKGKFNVHIATVTKWIPVSECTLTGSLQFKYFDGYSAIMENIQSKETFKYSLEMFSKLIPYMANGIITGTFHYEPYGSRMLHYVPVLPEVQLFSGALHDKSADVN